MTLFQGFPEQALDFYDGLLADNSKPYWTDHKGVYETCVREPALALMADLGPEFGAGKLFRPYRDVRFSKDKTPYKDHTAFVVEDGPTALYCQLGADGLFVGGGMWHCATDQGKRLRAAIDDERPGEQLAAMLEPLLGRGFRLQGERYERLPKEHDADHPRADLLHQKSFALGRDLGAGAWLHTPNARAKVVEAWRAVAPVNAWLAQHVGVTREVVRPRGGR